MDSSKSANGSVKKLSVEKIYQKKTQLEHILLRPDTYIGSVERVEQEMWVWDFATEKMVKKNIKYVPGLFKIFDEILVNAADNKIRDPSMSVIKINIDKEQNMIKVYNNGKGIPIVEHKDEKVFVPTLIFGHLLTSSNYDDNEKKVTGGRNGYGAKLCNIFSTKFIVETSCKESKKYFKQTWQANMGKTQDPTIKPNKDEDFTSVTFYPDLKKFGMDSLEEDTILLLARRAYDIAASTRGVKVYLNDKRLPISKFEDYCKLYVANNTGDSEIDMLNSSSQAKIIYENPNERWEVAVSYSDIGFQQVSFVNSIATTKGGRHVDYICDQIVKYLGEVINKKSGKNSTQVKPFQIKNHLWLFVNCLIVNPVFESQTKECMSLQVKNFGSKCQLTDEFLKKVASKAGIVDRVLNWLAFKEKTDLEKTGPKSKQSKVKGIPKLDDANNAGTRDSLNCTLILTEGDSAKTLAVAGLGVLGRDRYGVFPLRGKMLNVREATPKQILENAEITSICKIIGLNFKEKYESKESLKNLRYGKIMIMTDQDHDGSHIKGLIINFIHYQWPNLLKHGFIEEFITPIIKVFKSKKAGSTSDNVEKSFYSMPEFEEWQKSTPDWHTWKIKYYKGLGTSTSKEAKEYFSDMNRHCIKFEYNGTRDDLAIQLAFNKKLVEDRKDWLTKFMENRNEENKNYLYQKDTKKINYSQFINKELVLFSNLDNERSIPCLVDGFKPGQRKVLFACFKRNLQKEIKVAQLAGSVAELSAYHHGEQSLMSTIINLAQNFVGSNNLNLLLPIGQFGTRLHGGKDAASPRYIFTNLNVLTRFIFNPKDDPLFDYINDDGQFVEPEYYCPILPMVLVNGAEGIGTGFAVKIPNFNPREIIDNLIRLIKGQDLIPMKPFYKNFKGSIERLDDLRFVVNGEVAIIFDDNDSKNDYTIEISELPIGVWTQVYKETVLETYLHGTDSKTGESQASTKSGPFTPLINDYKEYHTDCTVRFIVKMSSKQYQHAMDQGGLHKFFKLQKSLSLTNMVLFDAKGRLKRYESPNEILQEFYAVRLNYYSKRKEYMESMLGAESAKLNNIARFILEKIEGKIKVENLRKNDLIKMLVDKGYESDPVKKWKEKITKEKGYLHDSNSSQENLTVLEQDTDTNKNQDFNYLLSMPLWNLTLEKKEEILKQQKLKLSELKTLQSKTIKDLWLEDLDEFKQELDKSDLREKEELELTIKKSIKSQKSSAKTNQISSIRHEYLPDPDGERVVPVADLQLIAKAEKDAQQKVLNKAKKEESQKGLTIVDIVTNENKFDEEQLKQINEIASNLANPIKTKTKIPATNQKTPSKKTNEENENDISKLKSDPADQTINESVVNQSVTKPKAKIEKEKKEKVQKTPTKKKEKVVINTDSEESFDEEKTEINVEKRQLGRARKAIKYNFADESESDDDEFNNEEGNVSKEDLNGSVSKSSIQENLKSEEKDVESTKKRKPTAKKEQAPEKLTAKRPRKTIKDSDDDEDEDFELEDNDDSDFESGKKRKKAPAKKKDEKTVVSKAKKAETKPKATPAKKSQSSATKMKSAEFIDDSDSSSEEEKPEKATKRKKKTDDSDDDLYKLD